MSDWELGSWRLCQGLSDKSAGSDPELHSSGVSGWPTQNDPELTSSGVVLRRPWGEASRDVAPREPRRSSTDQRTNVGVGSDEPPRSANQVTARPPVGGSCMLPRHWGYPESNDPLSDKDKEGTDFSLSTLAHLLSLVRSYQGE